MSIVIIKSIGSLELLGIGGDLLLEEDAHQSHGFGDVADVETVVPVNLGQ